MKKKYLPEILLIALSLLLLFLLIFGSQFIKRFSPTKEEAPIPAPVTLFGFPVDSFRIIEGRVLPNQNLGEILTGFDVSMAKIDQLARCSEGIFDLKKIRSGQNYYFFQHPDTSKDNNYLVYEKNRIEYVIFNLTDSLNISTGKKEVKARQKSVSGVITSNLWNTLEDKKLDPNLALKLSDIYAWTIDFFGIQKGDRFRVLYEEQFVDSVSIGIGPIFAAEFEHMGRSYLSFRFFQDDHFDYFDDKGENLRKAFLKAPLNFSRISSRFSGSRFHPILRIRRPHFGVDYTASRGTPVMSIGEGTVIERSHQGGSGNYVKIRHNTVYTTTYMHLSGFAAGISPGTRVSQGQVIGYVGSTGLSTGPHLDFRIYKNGTPVDPLKIEAPPAEPVKPELKPAFINTKDSLIYILYSIEWNR